MERPCILFMTVAMKGNAPGPIEQKLYVLIIDITWKLFLFLIMSLKFQLSHKFAYHVTWSHFGMGKIVTWSDQNRWKEELHYPLQDLDHELTGQ